MSKPFSVSAVVLEGFNKDVSKKCIFIMLDYILQSNWTLNFANVRFFKLPMQIVALILSCGKLFPRL